MKISGSLFGAVVLALLLVGSNARPAAAQSFGFSLIPCSFCSLPGTWTLFANPTGRTGGTASSVYTFTSDGAVIASDPNNPGSFHGTWQRVDSFHYSMSLVRKTSTGWERVRLLLSHVSCDDLVGQQKYDTLTCSPATPAGNPSCDPEGPGWVNQGGTDANPTPVRLDKYARSPFTLNAQ